MNGPKIQTIQKDTGYKYSIEMDSYNRKLFNKIK